MPLAPGTTIGPYQIIGPLGAGGMGEVYRARDARLARDVAIKVLPASFVSDPDRLRRFEQEARATGQLNHPNILAVHDTGVHDGVPYVVAELLEGATLRDRLAGGALPVRKALDYARQCALGLAAAHQKGIVHRDLKPENLFVTHDGRLKILDFGLAKFTRPEGPAAAEALTSAPTRADTGAGIVLGTAGYMSPEQVRGAPTDHRSDIFAFGSILYEMLAGRRAFAAPTSVETMNAILKEDPPEIVRAAGDLPPGLARIVQHCLEKSPEERFQSARDLGFQLEAQSGTSAAGTFAAGSAASGTSAAAATAAGATASGSAPVIPGPHATGSGIGRAAGGVRVPLWTALGAAALTAAAAAALAWFAARQPEPPGDPAVYRQLTFRQGTILSARFPPDGDSVIYAGALDGNPVEILSTRAGSPESRSLGLPPAEILSISSTGELALLLDPHFTIGFMRSGTLARAPYSGGVPREILQDVQDADWSPDGKTLAVIHNVAGRCRLEYPIGTVLHESTAWMSSVRISHDGRHIAFVDHPGIGDNRGRMAVVDRTGRFTPLTDYFAAAGGVAWTPTDDEIWFTAGTVGLVRALNAVTLDGRQRMVDGVPADINLNDISHDGKVLLGRHNARRSIVGTRPGDPTERDLGWLDWSRPGALSDDGEWVLFEEQGQGGGVEYSVYLRRTDGSPPVRLGEGTGLDLSEDGQWVLTLPTIRPDHLVLIPRAAGSPRTIPLDGLRPEFGGFMPGDRQILLAAAEADRAPQFFLIDLDGKRSKPLTPEGVDYGAVVSDDGRRLVTTIGRQAAQVFSLEGDGGAGRPVPGSLPGDLVMAWGRDEKSILVGIRSSGAFRVDRIDLATGKRSPWKNLVPADRAGLIGVDWVLVSKDERSYIYSYRRILSTLYLVEGLR